MATFSSVTTQHVLQALAEHDERGPEEFLAVHHLDASPGYTLVHEGRSYDAGAVLGVAHRYATGRLATSDEVQRGIASAVAILRRRGFQVTEPVSARAVAPARATRTTTPRTPRAPRATTTRSRPAEERVAAICPTCSTALPATGICDYCG